MLRPTLIIFSFPFANSDGDNESEIELNKHWKAELDLTMTCLQTNPKSYGIWHHRSWTMLQTAQPDWKKGK